MTLPAHGLPAGTLRRVRIVGTGLLGASIGMALTRQGIDVELSDSSPTAQALARDLGAGRLAEDGDDAAAPELVVVAVPPDVTARVIADQLHAYPTATVTDIASVKGRILDQVRALVEPRTLDRYIGSHPMAGRERSGAIAARADLFAGRPWVICTDEDTPAKDLQHVVDLARLVGGTPVHLDADRHDAAVARISHAPQVMSSLMAARLKDAPMDAVALAGQGLRDVTRIAASDPALWAQILDANAVEVRNVLTELREDLDTVIGALDGRVDALGVLASAIGAGNEGQARIPGKHGTAPTVYSTVTVLVGDKPGELGRLFTEMGEAGINLEDLQLEHANGQQFGLAEVSVLPAARGPLIEELRARGWTVPE
ncbi:prephenate dehydrogenase [Saxibacter everestensis]|uniref:Prephenate dehydrogenase n=1 Tax=Saxibacter everestensis TaxID=2909229 RepID=A0ABY8QW31_9MICO|nr:prephenate dehydrogenase [Brevibacteriaceae bacterium ZFBP1038]